jgi:DNA-binding Xre family transcriptional regulator
MYITLKTYLERLETFERSKPKDQRHHIPSLRELAKDVGIHEVTMNIIANNNIRQLNLDTGAQIITALRRRGFDVGVSDLLAYRAPEDLAQ